MKHRTDGSIRVVKIGRTIRVENRSMEIDSDRGHDDGRRFPSTNANSTVDVRATCCLLARENSPR
jgi:hypothetical protein